MPELAIDSPLAAAANWRQRFAVHMRRHFWLKFAGISAFMWLFFIVYFELLRHPVHAVTTMPLTALDHLIPLQPAWLPAYLSLWLYVGTAPGLLLTVRQLLVYGLWATTMCAVGLACFYFWPTAVPPTGIDVGNQPGFALLRGVDAAGNACPSLHVASAAFTVLWIDALLREMRAPGAVRLLNLAWFAAIAYSTLATKQHVVLDLLAGLLLGVAFAWSSLTWRPRTPRAAYPSGYHPTQVVTGR